MIQEHSNFQEEGGIMVNTRPEIKVRCERDGYCFRWDEIFWAGEYHEEELHILIFRTQGVLIILIR